jgi:chemotaxis protein MotA
MLVIIGYIVVIGSVLGGFVWHGGKLGVLVQPAELVIICGGAIGAFVVGNNMKTLKASLASLAPLLKGSKYTRARYMALMALLYDILTKIRKEGMMAIERDLEAPDQSPVFSKHPEVSGDHHLIEFITDYLRLMVSGNLNPLEIETLMDQEIDTHHHEGDVPAQAIQKVADGLPAFGIVAAVMGVVNVMGSVGEPPAVLGGKIGAALVGTFIGILFAYGFVGPLSGLIQQKLEEATKELQCVKVTLLACLQGYAPQVAVEFGRKVLYSTERPTFAELETHVKQKRTG